MISEKIKIRLSSFVVLIIENDCQKYGFINHANNSNKNKFLNQLIPNMVKIRQSRRKAIEKTLKQDFNKQSAEDIYQSVNTVIDTVYFYDEELSYLDNYLWLRPSKNALTCFNEIEEVECKISCLPVSNYIRGLLNEYSRLPQYKRGEILFSQSLSIIKESIKKQTIIKFHYNGKSVKVYSYAYMYGYLYNQNNFLIGYEINNSVIRSFDISKIEYIYNINTKFKSSTLLDEKLKLYLETYDYSDEHIETFKENKNEEN